MLSLKFRRAKDPPYFAGPFNEVRLIGEKLWVDAGTVPLAVHERHQWTTPGGRYSRLEVIGRVMVELRGGDEAPKRLGPFNDVSSVDRVVYVGTRVFAFCDEQEDAWYAYDDGRHWAAIWLREAEENGLKAPVQPVVRPPDETA